ncbi:formyltransferase family protein [Halobacterium bonnevillei]|uniref:Methionyl-tRNA formyltransferase-like protein n=1 Tax=Halobacterium bonnevillei TaxID=2692200 RepID=A0A6B0SI92_9EURY|nr:formyltransferase family protein [Halobacterium bonnevillei]MXR21395.1 methionyl-tRNA formyltransferase-like protein [Halobacterium bonnevillei]
MTEAEPAQVCLLLDGETLSAWAAAATQRMVAETDAEISLVVENTATSERSPLDALRRVVELREWAVVAAAGEVFGRDSVHLQPVPVRSIDGAEDADWVSCEPRTVDGWKVALTDRVVDRLAETDVAVLFGFGFLVGDTLDAPEMGVLSFHHGDVREYRGKPMGFWEYVHGRETAGVTLQRINETLDGGEVVVSKHVDIADAPTWGAVQRRLFDASEDMLAEAVRRLRRPDFEPEAPPADELADLYTTPRGRPVLTYLWKTARGTLLG